MRTHAQTTRRARASTAGQLVLVIARTQGQLRSQRVPSGHTHGGDLDVQQRHSFHVFAGQK